MTYSSLKVGKASYPKKDNFLLK